LVTFAPHPNPPPRRGEGVKKLEMFPLILPSPARGGGKATEIQEEIPSPLRGEGQGEGDNAIFSHVRGGEGGGDVFRKFSTTSRLSPLLNGFPRFLLSFLFCPDEAGYEFFLGVSCSYALAQDKKS